MRNNVAAIPVTRALVSSHGEESWAKQWPAWREPLAGALIATGLGLSFIIPSILPVHWWMVAPLAMLGGLLRQQRAPHSRLALLPFWAFCAVVLLFALYAASYAPMTGYGQTKTVNFLVMAAAAYLTARGQAPLTAQFMRGMRWGLIASLVLTLIVIYLARDLFLQQQHYGIEELKEAVATVTIPLVVAFCVVGLLPRTATPWAIFVGGVTLVLGAALEIFVRGRFHAIMLCLLAALVVLGPPWKHIFWRVLATAVLAVIVLAIYVNVLPLMGDSFTYLTWVDPESAAGRLPAWNIALNGFWGHPFGQGIGSFVLAGGEFEYPHNVILEVAYEMGILGVLSMLGIYLATLWRVVQLWTSPPHRVLAAITFLVFAHMLKAGDISTIAFHWVFLYVLIVCTPLATSWPLLRGREAV